MFLPLLFVSFVTISAACTAPCKCVEDALYCVNKGLNTLDGVTIPKHISKLYLSGNKLTNNFLSKITRLKLTVLDLRYNDISELLDGRFPSTLKVLYLDYNRVSFNGLDPFGGTEDTLVTISLSNNLISSEISTVMFYSHKKLEHLDLSHNFIPSLEANTIFPSSLKSLDLSYNPISRIYLATFRLTIQLLTLDLRWIGMMTKKSSYFKECSSLKRLHLGGKNLTEISGNTFHGLTSLEKLEISESAITILPSYVFADLPKLRVLNLNRNSFNYFEENLFGNFSGAVQQLYLEDNEVHLQIRQKLFKEFRSLLYLSLKGNKIATFPWSLGEKLPNLQYLDLAYNNIIEMEGTKYVFPNLIGLNVSSSGISDLVGDFFDYFPVLESLDVTNNILSLIENEWNTTSLTEIATAGNRWNCNCSMKSAYISDINFPCKATTELSVHFVGVTTDTVAGSRDFCITCAEPPEDAGIMFFKTTQSMSGCDVKGLGNASPVYYAIPVAAVVIVILVIAIIVLVARGRNGRNVTADRQITLPTASSNTLNTETSAYHGIENLNQQYTCADDGVRDPTTNQHIYWSIRNHGPYSENRAQQKVRHAAPEDAYIDPITQSHPSMEIRENHRGTIPSGPYSIIPDANHYSDLPAPPSPPTSEPSYMLDMTARRQSTSYMDFCNPESVARKIGISTRKKQTVPKMCMNWNDLFQNG